METLLWIVFEAMVVGSPIFCSSASERGVSIGVGGSGINGTFLAAAAADIPAAAVERDRSFLVAAAADVPAAAVERDRLLFLDVLAVERLRSPCRSHSSIIVLEVDRVVFFKIVRSYSAFRTKVVGGSCQRTREKVNIASSRSYPSSVGWDSHENLMA